MPLSSPNPGNLGNSPVKWGNYPGVCSLGDLPWSTITLGILFQMELLQLNTLIPYNKQPTCLQSPCLKIHLFILGRNWWDSNYVCQTTYYMIGSLLLLFARECENTCFRSLCIVGYYVINVSNLGLPTRLPVGCPKAPHPQHESQRRQLRGWS